MATPVDSRQKSRSSGDGDVAGTVGSGLVRTRMASWTQKFHLEKVMSEPLEDDNGVDSRSLSSFDICVSTEIIDVSF